VAANSGLRAALAQEGERRGLAVHLPPLALCTDNAAMVGLAAQYLPAIAWPDYLSLSAHAAGMPA
jgi:N6-L-threonylcarbamoyladenine synthase